VFYVLSYLWINKAGRKRLEGGLWIIRANQMNPCKTIYHVSAIIVILLAGMIIVPTITLLLGASIGPVIIPLVMALTFGVYLYLYGISVKTVKDAYAAMLLIGIFLIIAGSIIDLSYDGITYHKTAVGALKNGWNPHEESIAVWARRQPGRSEYDHYDLWVDHYPRGTWYIGAIFYCLTGNIESGKAYDAGSFRHTI